MDYVWDYGSLQSTEELRYIEEIVKTSPSASSMPTLVIWLIYTSQECIIEQNFTVIGMIYKVIRGVECAESVSMRDVKRCMTLLHWFSQNLQSAKNNALPTIIPSVVLALAHCYYCRLGTTELRRQYLGIYNHGNHIDVV